MTPPPAKQSGHATGRRRLAGELLDVAGAAELLGLTEKAVRARVARRCLPFRRWAGRIVFRRAELLEFVEKLDGVGLGEALANASARDRRGGDAGPA
jgi:hypothetical protein